MALSNRAEQIQMHSSLDGYDAWNSMAIPHAGTTFATEMVSAVTWDEFVEKHNLHGRVTMMKIDVEGWETHVLAGGSATLSRKDAPILQVEFTDKAAEATGGICKDLYHQLEKLGYRLFRFNPLSNTILADPLRETYPYVNLIAAKDPDQVNRRLKMRRKFGLPI